MDSYCIMPDHNNDQWEISHYQLDFQENGNHRYYTWSHCPPEDISQKKIALLVDLNNVHVPEFAIDKLVCSILVPAAGIIFIAFANCHSHNQQEIKRKLKAGNVKLYSKTAFFADIEQAKQWLKAQCASC